MPGIQLHRTPTGFRFELIAANGQPVAGSEVYSARAACIKGAESVLFIAPKACCVDLTRQETAANPRFEVFQDKAGCFRFRLRSRNGKIVAASEPYLTRYAAHQGVEAVRRCAEEIRTRASDRLCTMAQQPSEKV